MKTFFDLDVSGVEFVFNLNYLGTLLPTQVFTQDMMDKKGASIINISSMNAFTPLTKIPAYSGARLPFLTLQWLAVHFSKLESAATQSPGFFVSKQNEKLLLTMTEHRQHVQKILRNTPMDRFGKSERVDQYIIILNVRRCFKLRKWCSNSGRRRVLCLLRRIIVIR